MTRLLAIGVFTFLCACHSHPAAKKANELTRHYEREQLRAYAAGNDCLVLLVRSRTPLDDATVETVHYGTGAPGEQPIHRFAQRHKFRAVAYKDEEGRLWTYGATTRDEAASMPTCR